MAVHIDNRNKSKDVTNRVTSKRYGKNAHEVTYFLLTLN